MNQEATTTPLTTLLLTFLAGAAAGAVVVALTTRKTGAQRREDIKEAVKCAKLKADEMASDVSGAWAGMKERTGLAAADLKRGFTDAANDLKA